MTLFSEVQFRKQKSAKISNNLDTLNFLLEKHWLQRMIILVTITV